MFKRRIGIGTSIDNQGKIFGTGNSDFLRNSPSLVNSVHHKLQ